MVNVSLRIKFSTYSQTISHGQVKRGINFETSQLSCGLRGTAFSSPSLQVRFQWVKEPGCSRDQDNNASCQCLPSCCCLRIPITLNTIRYTESSESKRCPRPHVSVPVAQSLLNICSCCCQPTPSVPITPVAPYHS